jgi:hypothetical protein
MRAGSGSGVLAESGEVDRPAGVEGFLRGSGTEHGVFVVVAGGGEDVGEGALAGHLDTGQLGPVLAGVVQQPHGERVAG